MARMSDEPEDIEFSPDDIDLGKDLDELILAANGYKNMAPYFSYLAKHSGKPIANVRSRYNYLRRRAGVRTDPNARRGRPRKKPASPEGDLVMIFSETFRVKPSRETISILHDCVAQYGSLRVAMAMERIRPEGGDIFARAILAELGKRINDRGRHDAG